MTDFEMDKMYTITGRELLALLSLIPDGDEKAKVIVENVAGRGKVNESQNDFLGLPAEEGLPCTHVDCERLREMRMTELKPCPFCGSTDVHLIENDPGKSEISITCKDCNVWVDHMFYAMTKEQAIELWNRRYLNGMPISLHTMIPRVKE